MAAEVISPAALSFSRWLGAIIILLLAVLILGERFQTYHAVGLLLVLGGIGLAEYSARR